MKTKRTLSESLLHYGVATGLICSLFGLLFATAACTQNARAKSWGGKMQVDLPAGTKLVSASWKQDQLWYLYRPALAGETPVTSILQEDSSFNMLEGQVVFVEK